MAHARTLAVGVLVLAAVMAITAAIVAIAPYIAILIVGGALIFWIVPKDASKPPALSAVVKKTTIKPVKPPWT